MNCRNLLAGFLLLSALTACGPSKPADAGKPAEPSAKPVEPGSKAGAIEGPKAEASPNKLAQARKNFRTKIVREEKIGEAPPAPPSDKFTLVRYPSSVGPLAAYISIPPAGPQKRPAIVWLVGGFSNSVSGVSWTPGEAANDQSAAEFWKAGIITMYPSLRGGNDNGGVMENFYGEVDDVLAAAEFLSKQPGVDPTRIYLGGHSTGGTLALLVAETSARFRGVFSFGPVAEFADYGGKMSVYDATNPEEAKLRAPNQWLDEIVSPTFIFEGKDPRGNLTSLLDLMATRHPKHVHFFPVQGGNHFSILQPLSRMIAAKILGDSGAETKLAISEAEIKAAMGR